MASGSSTANLPFLYRAIRRRKQAGGTAALLAFLAKEVRAELSNGISHSDSFGRLHPQLARDTVPVGDLPLSRVLLANDANYPWLILVPRRPGLVELIDLEENAQVQLLGEIAAAARALKAITECDKLNIAALGNQVAQLHVHVIAPPPQRRCLAEAGVGRGTAPHLRSARARGIYRRITCPARHRGLAIGSVLLFFDQRGLEQQIDLALER